MDEITSDTAALRAAIDQSRDRAGRARVKPKLRARVMAYVAERVKAGATRDVLARELGVGLATIHRWVTPPKLQRVEIVDSTTVTVHARHGVRIEGLTLAQVAELLRTL